MKRFFVVLNFCLLLFYQGYGQSPSFKTFINPVIPGDHPDCTLTKIGNDFYTTGSSFNPTPVIYRSTDLVHWEAIAQPVSASWSGYDDLPGKGCWGGQVVYHNNKYWDFFSRANTMHFVTADKPEGPWSMPTRLNNPSQLSYGLGYDNSIFIDDDGKWYLVVKNGQPNNGIVELGDDGQPTGTVYNLKWLNPLISPPDTYLYSWAEGPVMWKYNNYYFYSFARDLSGGQKVMRSRTLTADSSSWEMLGDLFNENDPLKSGSLFASPNHSSNVIMIDDSTSWVIHPLYAKGEWKGQGRQGLLNQVRYDSNDKPTADYPVNKSFTAPNLPSSGIPWMVPHSDFFDSDKLNPEWSFLGYTPASSYSLTNRSGWLTLSPKRASNTIIKNDGEHNYSLITRLEFNAQVLSDEAGLIILRGDEKSYVKLYSSIDDVRHKTIFFIFDNIKYEAENIAGDTVWLKIIRVNHSISGYFSSDGFNWIQVGQNFNISTIDSYSDFSTFTGTRQGLYVQNSTAYFDFYIYRDAYTPILAECPANQVGTAKSTIKINGINLLDNIHNNDWALYAGVEFGNAEYIKKPDSLIITASSALKGGVVEVWLDSLDSGTKIAECTISNTGSWTIANTFTTNILSQVSGKHDVYVKFLGAGSDKLFMLQWLTFMDKSKPETSTDVSLSDELPKAFILGQNYPNPFNPATQIKYTVPQSGYVTLKIYNLLGQEVSMLFEGVRQSGNYSTTFDGSGLASGVYCYRLQARLTNGGPANNFMETKKLILIKRNSCC